MDSKLLEQLLLNQQAQLEKLTSLTQELMAQKQTPQTGSPGKGKVLFEVKQPTIVELAVLVKEFKHDPKEDAKGFSDWYGRHKEVFKTQSAHLGDAGRVQLLLIRLDTAANKLYRDSIAPKEPDAFTFDETVAALMTLFNPRETLFRKRLNTLTVRKLPNERHVEFGARINQLAEEFQCGAFGADQLKTLLFVLGYDGDTDREIRTRLLNVIETNPKVTLTEMINEASRITGISEDRDIKLAPGPSSSIHQVNSPAGNKRHQRQRQKGKGNSSSKTGNTPKSPCWGCGRMHMYADCEFKKKTCSDCQRTGHKAGYCAAFKTVQNQNKSKVNVVKVTEVSTPDLTPAAEVKVVKRKFLELLLNGTKTTMQYDTAADISIITKDTWQDLGAPDLDKLSFTAMDAQNNVMPFIGELPVTVEFTGKVIRLRCFVSETHSNLFGIEWIDAFDLWDQAPSAFCLSVQVSKEETARVLEEIKTEFASVFTPGTGRCEKFKVHLQLKPEAKPVFRKKRPVPFRSVDSVSAELDRLEAAGIIAPVRHSEFAAPIVVVQKPNGSIRICGDYSTGLNDSLLKHEYPIPTPEDIFASLSNCRIFSQIDLSDAYLQLEMDEDSSKLLTINTIKGLYAFKRLCPGVRPAAAIFQQTMETMLAGVAHVIVYFDDILIATPSFAAHKTALKEVFNRLQDYNMRVRLAKCKFFQRSVKYLGIIVDQHGQRPDPEKISAITTMPPPENAQQLRSYLGALTFYSRFIKGMSTIRNPFNQLLKKDTDFIWNEECQKSFEKFKDILASNLLLTHYDPALPIVVAADASQTGLGGIAYHTYEDGSMKAFIHVSRRLTPAESRYSQIELEALAIVWTLGKVHKYVFGRAILLYTDHRPLLAIFGSKKGIPAHVANRIQRWAIALMAYDFEIKYTRTDEFGHADVLSRLILKQREEAVDDLVIAEVAIQRIFVNLLNEALPVSFKEIVAATEEDQVLPTVIDYVKSGWPCNTNRIECTPALGFFRVRESLSLVDGALTYMDRTVIPPILQQRMLTQLHASHPGMTRMKALARCYVYWPGLDNDIESLVRSCVACQAAAKMPVKATLSSWPMTTSPWERVHIDFAGPIDNNMFLLMVDAYSKWPEIYRMTTTSATATIKVIREVCARFGNMATLVSDNGGQFTSEEFGSFCKGEDIEHQRTAPYHPQSNGQCERLVDTFKRALVKHGSSTDEAVQQFLLHYRATPNASAPQQKSPAELMFGRKIRIKLDAVLARNTHPIQRDVRMEEQFNKRHGAKDRVFTVKQRVLVRLSRNHGWQKGEIVEAIGTRMYNVLTKDRLLRLHGNQLRNDDTPTDDIYDNTPKSGATESVVPRTRTNPRAVTRSSPPVLRPRKAN